MHPVKMLTCFPAVVLIAAILSLAHCASPEQPPVGSPVDSTTVHPIPDTAGLTALVRDAYRWRYNNTVLRHIVEFEGLQKHPDDPTYTGIDLVGQDSIVKLLRESGYFSEKFISHYQRIGKRMDQDLGSGKADWLVGDMWPWYDADPWCLCQDIPTDLFWDKLQLDKVTISKQEASFVWIVEGTNPYQMKAAKESGHWKISYLQGYDFRNIFPN